jgi:anionic cell wall polymer biosynthesis LytR-Cps2A-Psr (LCP) family protein
MDYTDPTQDLVIDIQPGQQHLDGLDAEGFVRFRKGYREDGTFFEIGDAARKKNQLYFLQEMIKQKGTLQNIDKIPGIIEILGNNIRHSIGLGDMLSSYITMATDIITKDYEIVSENLNSDKMIRVDGASYVVLE